MDDEQFVAYLSDRVKGFRAWVHHGDHAHEVVETPRGWVIAPAFSTSQKSVDRYLARSSGERGT